MAGDPGWTTLQPRSTRRHFATWASFCHCPPEAPLPLRYWSSEDFRLGHTLSCGWFGWLYKRWIGFTGHPLNLGQVDRVCHPHWSLHTEPWKREAFRPNFHSINPVVVLQQTAPPHEMSTLDKMRHCSCISYSHRLKECTCRPNLFLNCGAKGHCDFCQNAYHAICVRKEDKWKMAFNTPTRHKYFGHWLMLQDVAPCSISSGPVELLSAHHVTASSHQLHGIE